MQAFTVTNQIGLTDKEQFENQGPTVIHSNGYVKLIEYSDTF